MKKFIVPLYQLWLLVIPLICLGLYCGTETPNERVLTVYLPDGKTPAPYTGIAFMPSNSVNVERADTVIADADGRFTVPNNLLPGTWSVMFTYNNNETYAAWQRSVTIDDTGHTVHSDTLEHTGTLSGIVNITDLLPRDSSIVPESVTVTVLLVGTTRSVDVDSSGNFTLTAIPSGTFTLYCSVSSTLPEFEPLDIEIDRSTGEDMVLSDTLIIPYREIPSVQGLQAVFDSLNGIVDLQWNSIPREYGYEAMVLRTAENTVSQQQDTVAVIQSNRFQDTVYTSDTAVGLYLLTDTFPRILEYRVVLRDTNQTTGEPSEPVPVTIMSPFIYRRTTLSPVSRCAATMQECTTTAAGDTFIIETVFSSNYIPIGALRYHDAKGDSLLFQTRFSPPVLDGTDTVHLNCIAEGSYRIIVTAVDTSGVPTPSSTDTLFLSVMQRLIGDVTFDGIISSADSLAIMRYLEDEVTFSDEERYYSDVNLDSAISVHDTRLITCRYTDIVSDLPVAGMIGDIDRDGLINNTEIEILGEHIRKEVYMDRVGIIFADVDGNDTADVYDAQLIGRYILEDIDEFPFTKK